MTKINVFIPKPCHENWHAMTPEGQGRFCNSCQKKVFDFTKASDREIVTAFQENEHLCGRFLTSQLHRDLVKPEKKNPIWLASASALISFIGFGTNEAIAQGESVKTIQTDRKVVGKPAAPNTKITIIGKVVDYEILPIEYVMVTAKNKDAITYTDKDGNFTIIIDRNDTLLFSKKDYDSEEDEYTFDSDRGHFTVVMGKRIRQSVTVGAIESKPKKRSFVGRIFHRIGNLFR